MTVRKEVGFVRKIKNPIPEGYEVVYTPYITLRNGKRIYAASRGWKAFRLVFRKK